MAVSADCILYNWTLSAPIGAYIEFVICTHDNFPKREVTDLSGVLCTLIYALFEWVE